MKPKVINLEEKLAELIGEELKKDLPKIIQKTTQQLKINNVNYNDDDYISAMSEVLSKNILSNL
jgi:hypothetical protein